MVPPAQYEAWYSTPKGLLVDTLEKEVIAGLARVKPGDRVLEIGCGTGHFSDYFTKLGAEVTALDTSPDMLTFAGDKFGGRCIDFKSGDAYTLPFPDRSFDLAAMITVLEFIKSPKRAIEEAFRVSRGRVFLGILNRSSLLACRRKKSGKQIWQDAHFYTLKEVEEMLPGNRKITWKGAVHLPLIDSMFAYGVRLNIERLLSAIKTPGAAFIGVLAEEREGK